MPPIDEQKVKTSAGLETATETAARAKAMVQPSISAEELANPPQTVQPPVPTVSTNDGSRTQGLVDNVTTNTQGFIASQSEEAAKAKELAGLLGDQTFDGQGQRTQLGEQYGLPQNLTRLTDIQTQLTKANTASGLTKARIGGAAGQTAGQLGRELTQEDRENAVRNAGLAAEAAVLQGSIETASTLVNNAMSDYYNDRQLQNANMIQQLNYFSGIADEQTSQLLGKEQRKYEEDQALVQELKTSISDAMVSGASQDEVSFMTDPEVPDDVKLRTAKAIAARGAGEMRNLEIAKANASIASSYASAASSRASAARNTAETKLLNAPVDPTQLDKATLDALDGLSDGQRTDIPNARSTVGQIDRMVELIDSAGDVALLTRATEEGREFLRIRADVTDKLARERTGAVVSSDETKAFKDILGIGLWDVMSKDDEELKEGLMEFRAKHQETLSLNDPTGLVRAHLEAESLEPEIAEEVNAVWGVTTQTTTNVGNYFNK